MDAPPGLAAGAGRDLGQQYRLGGLAANFAVVEDGLVAAQVRRDIVEGSIRELRNFMNRLRSQPATEVDANTKVM